jgi:hypothetical protein
MTSTRTIERILADELGDAPHCLLVYRNGKLEIIGDPLWTVNLVKLRTKG